MSDERDIDEREALAAEYALGVLDDADRRAAEALAARDPSFAAAVERWRAQLAPMVETAAPAAPPAGLWDRIEAGIAPKPAETPAGTVAAPSSRPGLWSSLAFWRGLSFASTAAAAACSALLVLSPPAVPPVPVAPPADPGPIATAPLMMEGGAALVAAAYDPAHRRIIVTPTGRYELQPAQALELWIIVGDRAPRSLGVIDPANPQAHVLPADVRADLAAGAALAVSIEPTGGSPTGAPTGPVVAQGKLTNI